MSWFSKFWRRQHDKERCGIGFIRLPGGHCLTPACKIHDIEYLMAKNGNQLKGRKQIDQEMLFNMLTIANDRMFLGRWITKPQAYLFYYLVRWFGGIGWEGKE